jgi:hypothetical protein
MRGWVGDLPAHSEKHRKAMLSEGKHPVTNGYVPNQRCAGRETQTAWYSGIVASIGSSGGTGQCRHT